MGIRLAMLLLFLCSTLSWGGFVQAATVTYLVKPAQVKQSGMEVWQALRLGDSVDQGDAIRTGIGGRVEIEIDHKRHLRIAEATEITLSVLTGQTDTLRARIGLLGGRFWGSLRLPLQTKNNEQFQVSTSTAVIGVKGTSFGLDFDKTTQIAQVAVLSGWVSIHPGESALAPPTQIEGPREVAPPQQITKAEWFRLVSQGEYMVIQPGKIPTVKLLTDEMKQDPWIQFNRERDAL